MKVGGGGRARAAHRATQRKPPQMSPEQMMKKVQDILERLQAKKASGG